MESASTTLTPLALFLQAGPVRKSVILLLLVASIWCWVLIVEGAWSVRRLKRPDRAARNREAGAGTELWEPIVETGRQAAALAAETVRAKLKGDDRAVHVRGDRDAPHGRIVAAMDQPARNGLMRIARSSGRRVLDAAVMQMLSADGPPPNGSFRVTAPVSFSIGR